MISNNLFENLETIKEYKWVLPLVVLIITVFKDIIKNIIGSTIYNIIVICIISIGGVYVLSQFIEYLKYNNSYDIKSMKKELILFCIMILVTMIFLMSLLII